MKVETLKNCPIRGTYVYVLVISRYDLCMYVCMEERVGREGSSRDEWRNVSFWCMCMDYADCLIGEGGGRMIYSTCVLCKWVLRRVNESQGG